MSANFGDGRNTGWKYMRGSNPLEHQMCRPMLGILIRITQIATCLKPPLMLGVLQPFGVTRSYNFVS